MRARLGAARFAHGCHSIRDDFRQFHYRLAKRRMLRDCAMKLITIIIQLLAQPLKAIDEMIDLINRLH